MGLRCGIQGRARVCEQRAIGKAGESKEANAENKRADEAKRWDEADGDDRQSASLEPCKRRSLFGPIARTEKEHARKESERESEGEREGERETRERMCGCRVCVSSLVFSLTAASLRQAGLQPPC